MNDLERLVALEDIRLLRAKYCRYIDSGAFERLREIMVPHIVLDLSQTGEMLGAAEAGSIAPVHGLDNVVGYLNEHFTRLKMRLHIVTIPEIDFTDDEHATGIWRQETYVKEGRTDIPGSGIAFCTVYDRYEKVDGKWLIAAVRVELEMIM